MDAYHGQCRVRWPSFAGAGPDDDVLYICPRHPEFGTIDYELLESHFEDNPSHYIHGKDEVEARLINIRCAGEGPE